MKKVLLTATILMFSSVAAHANIILSLGLGQLSDSSGNPLPLGSTFSILLDKNGDGFGDLTSLTNSWTVGSDDVLLGRFGTNDVAGPGSFVGNVPAFNLGGGIDPGDALMLVWYKKAFNPADTGPGSGTDFGFYRSNSPDAGGDIGWNVPSDGASVNLNFTTDSLGGNNPDSAGFASLKTMGTQVVPEPVSCVLALIGGGAMALRRRFANV